MTGQRVEPALTPEEWSDDFRVGDDPEVWGYHVNDDDDIEFVRLEELDGIFPAEHRHGLAAVCLYEQPFGFTHEDLRLLRIALGGLEARIKQVARVGEGYAAADTLRSVIERIEALLPPVALPPEPEPGT